MAEKNQDLGITQVQDGKYTDITIPDLDLLTTYGLQVAWVYADKQKGISEFSDVFEFTTPGPQREEVTNVVWVWEGTTLKGTWNRTNGKKEKTYQIYLTADGTSIERSWTQAANLDTVTQTFLLTEERNLGNFGRIFRRKFTGFIKTTYLDGTTSGVSFTTPEYNDAICSLSIGASDWSITSISNGFTASWNVNSITYPTYKYTEVWVEDPDSLIYSKEYSGIGPATIKLISFAEHNVKIKHFSRSECSTGFSDIKKAKAFDPIQNDIEPPINDFTLGSATVSTDSNGLFSFDKKVLFTWTENSSTDTAGYRIRFRVNGSSDPYTYMSVPGKEKTSTYLFGLKGGQTYEIGVSTFDIYGNTNESQWRTYSPIVAPLSTELKPDVAITAGDMKLGYGIGGNNSQKGLYLGPENYWYIQGNTTVSSAARISIGGTNDKLVWDGSSLVATGTINANAGVFTGTVNIGSPTVNGQLNLFAGNNKFEIGRLKDINGNWLNEIGIQGTNSGQKYFQLDTSNGVLVNKGTIGGWIIDTNKISKNFTSLNSDGSITAGNSGQFTVSQSGELTATNAKVYGEIKSNTAEFGTFTNSTFSTLEKGWKIDGAKIRSSGTGTASGVDTILDGEWGAVAGANIVGSVLWLADLTTQQAYNKDEDTELSAPYGSDYISSSGKFRLGAGKIRYSPSLGLIVNAKITASDIYITDNVDGTGAVDFIKNDGTFSLGGGAFTYGGWPNKVFEINPQGRSFDQFKIKLNVTSNEDGTFGDSTVVQDKNGYLTTGRAFYYGGNSYPDGATSRSTSQGGRPFVVGDIWLSRKA